MGSDGALGGSKVILIGSGIQAYLGPKTRACTFSLLIDRHSMIDLDKPLPLPLPLTTLSPSLSLSLFPLSSHLTSPPPSPPQPSVSLNPGVDRFAFSVVWELDKCGTVISQWAGRSLICSCAKLTYPMVQKVHSLKPCSGPRQWACIAFVTAFNSTTRVDDRG